MVNHMFLATEFIFSAAMTLKAAAVFVRWTMNVGLLLWMTWATGAVKAPFTVQNSARTIPNRGRISMPLMWCMGKMGDIIYIMIWWQSRL